MQYWSVHNLANQLSSRIKCTSSLIWTCIAANLCMQPYEFRSKLVFLRTPTYELNLIQRENKLWSTNKIRQSKQEISRECP